MKIDLNNTDSQIDNEIGSASWGRWMSAWAFFFIVLMLFFDGTQNIAGLLIFWGVIIWTFNKAESASNKEVRDALSELGRSTRIDHHDV